jgi:nitrite reductase/ring-hydroxylating ferredoxin subunit
MSMGNSAENQGWQALPNLAGLSDGGTGLRFELLQGERTLPAFAIKHEGQVFAYLNQCAHVAMEMDWQAGHFFDFDQRFIMCATHGALYEPSTGVCVDGPCMGKHLQAVALRLDNGNYYAPQRI